MWPMTRLCLLWHVSYLVSKKKVKHMMNYFDGKGDWTIIILIPHLLFHINHSKNCPLHILFATTVVSNHTFSIFAQDVDVK